MKEIVEEGELCDLIMSLGNDFGCFELLLFLSRHPDTRFNRSVLLHAVTSQRYSSGDSLKKLIDKRFVVTSEKNGTILYSLTKEEPIHGLAARIRNTDQVQRRVMLERSIEAH